MPFDDELSVVISVGSHAVETKPPTSSEGTGGGRVMWYQTTYMDLKFPANINQVPKVFVSLYRGSKRCAFWVQNAVSISSFEDMVPGWTSLTRNPFGPLASNEY
eukprot:SAG31_NODE_9941_length_1207_cov_1.768051_1_plen_103_part_01